MPLRRVTLSGRFAQTEYDLEESTILVVAKGVGVMVADIAIALIVATYSFYTFKSKLVEPYERGFYCYEVPHLSNPFRPNTVSTLHLITVSLALPFIVIGIVEAIVFKVSEGRNRLRNYFYSATSIYLEYVASYTIATFAMEGMKCAFGRLRPHYLSVCKPDWQNIDCSDPNNYIENANCMGTDMHRIRIGRQSFPSGHTAAAVLLFTYLFFYLKGIVDATGNKLLRIIQVTLLSVVGAWTVLVMATRVTDYWHHPTDLLGGFLLGIFCAYIPLRKAHSSSVYKKRLLDNKHIS